MDMYCSECGKQNNDNAKFCTACGVRVVNSLGNLFLESQEIEADSAKQIRKVAKAETLNAETITKKTLFPEIIFFFSIGVFISSFFESILANNGVASFVWLVFAVIAGGFVYQRYASGYYKNYWERHLLYPALIIGCFVFISVISSFFLASDDEIHTTQNNASMTTVQSDDPFPYDDSTLQYAWYDRHSTPMSKRCYTTMTTPCSELEWQQALGTSPKPSSSVSAEGPISNVESRMTEKLESECQAAGRKFDDEINGIALQNPDWKRLEPRINYNIKRSLCFYKGGTILGNQLNIQIWDLSSNNMMYTYTEIDGSPSDCVNSFFREECVPTRATFDSIEKTLFEE